jgi:hypothetical protein
MDSTAAATRKGSEGAAAGPHPRRQGQRGGLCAGYFTQLIANRAEHLQQPRMSQYRFGLETPHRKTLEACGHPLGGG